MIRYKEGVMKEGVFSVRQNALAVYDLLMGYQDITLEDAQRRLHLSDEELEEALEVLREAYRKVFGELDRPVTV
ncbi:MAG: hypothetical protein OXS33_07185 [bacterium]|nr:hypothetical protein [bacterium]MDE0500331.1 hypothetical protein [bacterium]